MISTIFTAVLIFLNVFFGNDLVGKWALQTDQGLVSVEFKSDLTYLVDFGNDGQIDLEGTYTLEGNQMSIQDTKGANMCTAKGLYSFKVEGNTLTMTKVQDDCPGRGDTSQMVMTKM